MAPKKCSVTAPFRRCSSKKLMEKIKKIIEIAYFFLKKEKKNMTKKRPHPEHTCEQVIGKVVQRRCFIIVAYILLFPHTIMLPNVIFGPRPLVPLPLFLAERKRSIYRLLDWLQYRKRYICDFIVNNLFRMICV